MTKMGREQENNTERKESKSSILSEHQRKPKNTRKRNKKDTDTERTVQT